MIKRIMGSFRVSVGPSFLFVTLFFLLDLVLLAKSAYQPAETLGIIDNKECIELSGVTVGEKNKDILWVHNDRNNLPRLYALNKKAETVSMFDLDLKNESGMMSGDWEDMAKVTNRKGNGYDLCIGDVGNNPLEKKAHRLIYISEPEVKLNNSFQVEKVEFEIVNFEYPEGYACNSECLLIHPLTKEIIIISKSVKKDGKKVKGNFVWSLSIDRNKKKTYMATLVANTIPLIDKNKGKVTGGEISIDGKYLVIRTYETTAYIWKLERHKSFNEIFLNKPIEVTLAKEKGGEAICFGEDATELYTVYDGKKENRPLHVYERN